MKRKRKKMNPYVYVYYTNDYRSNDRTIRCCIGFLRDHSDEYCYEFSPGSNYTVQCKINGKWQDFYCEEEEGKVGCNVVWYRERNDEAAMNAFVKYYDDEISQLLRWLESNRKEKQIIVDGGVTYIEQEED